MITTSDEARSLYINKMGEHLGAQFHALWHEVALLHLRWAEFVELFGTKRSRIDLLNQAAPSFFRIVQDGLWDVTLLHIARLTDRPKSFGDKENLTIQNLPRLVDSRIKLRVIALVQTAISKATFCRDWRNRNIAHSDLKLALNESPTPLPDVDKQKTEEALSAIEAVLSEVHERYMDSAMTFKFVFNDGGANALLRVIDDGLSVRVA
jgi:HEPN superfamily AbiU2-like protein